MVYLLGKSLLSNYDNAGGGNRDTYWVHYMIGSFKPCRCDGRGKLRSKPDADQENIIFEKTGSLDLSMEMAGRDEIDAVVLFLPFTHGDSYI